MGGVHDIRAKGLVEFGRTERTQGKRSQIMACVKVSSVLGVQRERSQGGDELRRSCRVNNIITYND